MHWWLPQQGSTFAGPIDGLFIAILIITGIAFVLVEAGLIWFIVKYRGPGRKAFYTHGNTRAEVIWTTIPAVTMVALPRLEPLLGADQRAQQRAGERLPDRDPRQAVRVAGDVSRRPPEDWHRRRLQHG